MRIAVTVDPYIPIPPRYYGGIERVVDFLVRGLLERGHEVTLFAHPDTETDATLVRYGVPPHEGLWPRVRELWQVGACLYRLRRRIDIVHSFGRLAALLPVLPVRSLPKLQSYQRDVLPMKGIRRARLMAGGSLKFTACSTQMYARRYPEATATELMAPEATAPEWTTVYNGVDFDKYTFVPSVGPEAPLAFLGRIEHIKGTHHAIAVAKATGRQLLIAGNVADQNYFDEAVAPELDDDAIRYLGPVDDVQKNELLGRSAALLMTIDWEEPFGIVMAEAMACGTPVIAHPLGSMPELIRDRENGFLVGSIDEAVAAVRVSDRMDRTEVRTSVERRFDANRMVDEYLAVYHRVVGHHRAGRAQGSNVR